MSRLLSQDWIRKVQFTALLIGCVFPINLSWANDSWVVEFRSISGWSIGFQIALEDTNRYDYIEQGFSEIGECTGALSAAEFRSIQLLVNSIIREDHPVKLAKPEAVCSSYERGRYIKVEHGKFNRVAAEYGFSSTPICRAANFPESVSSLANKLERLGETKMKDKCLKEKALNPPGKPVLRTP